MDKLIEGRILLVGEGDFSFSLSFAKQLSWNSKVHITSSSLLAEDELQKSHVNGPANVRKLREEQKVRVLFSVDATKLEDNPDIVDKFDRIIFNFPHVGGKSNIKKNRELVEDFFKSAVSVLADAGDICVSFCRGQGGTPADDPVRAWYDSWQAVSAAAYQNLVLRELWPFTAECYPEYSSTGFRSLDKHFYTGGGSLTYVFRRCEPVVSPRCPTQLTSGVLHVGALRYQINSSYVAKKMSRKLHTLQKHPVHLTCQHILQTSAKFRNKAFEEVIEPSPIIISPQKSPLSYPLSEITEDKITQENGESSHCLMVRRTLMDHLDTGHLLNGLDPGKVYYMTGNVCRVRPHTDSNDLPVQHEMLLILKSSQLDKDFKEFKSFLSDSLSEVVDKENQLLVTKDLEEEVEWLGNQFSRDFLHSIEASYKSMSLSVTQACNQVRETGPAEIPKQPTKASRISHQLGYLGQKDDCILALLSLDAITMIKYDIPDARLLWAEDPIFLNQFSAFSPTESYSFVPLSLYPPLWRHDLSLWEDLKEPFDEQRLLDILREVCGDEVKKVLCVNVWEEPGSGRISRCYRVVYQSYEKAVSHRLAHQIQDSVRQTVADNMRIELR